MTEFHLSVAMVGGLVLAIGLGSAALKKHTFVTPPLLSLTAGVAFGPTVLGWLDPLGWGPLERILEEAARISLAIGLMAVALRIPPGYVVQHGRALVVLLGVVMPLMWLSTAVLVHLVLAVPFVVALLVGAVVCPTDPIAATSIVTGPVAERNIPDRVRHLISAETGLNDGLGYALVMLAVGLMTLPAADALTAWVTRTVLWKVGGGAAFGAFLGYLAGRLLIASERYRLIEKTSFLAYTVALSLLVLGAAELIGTEGILAVFLAGLAFDAVVGARERAEEESVQEAVDQFFTLPIFALLGLVLPWSAWAELGWSAVVLVVAVLVLRRLPATLVLGRLIPDLHGRGDASFVGWFGPMGASALLLAMVALRHTGHDEAWTIGSLLIASSVVVHGATATPFTRLYARSHSGRRLRQKGRRDDTGEH